MAAAAVVVEVEVVVVVVVAVAVVCTAVVDMGLRCSSRSRAGAGLFLLEVSRGFSRPNDRPTAEAPMQEAVAQSVGTVFILDYSTSRRRRLTRRGTRDSAVGIMASRGRGCGSRGWVAACTAGDGSEWTV